MPCIYFVIWIEILLFYARTLGPHLFMSNSIAPLFIDTSLAAGMFVVYVGSCPITVNWLYNFDIVVNFVISPDHCPLINVCVHLSDKTI